MKIEKLAAVIEESFPLAAQEAWDNSGFQIKFDGAEVKKVLVALDVTDEIIDEAEAMEVQAIVTHHPMIFAPVRQIYDNSVTGNHIVRLIKDDISVYACHTPFDKGAGGNVDYLAQKLSLQNVKLMETDEEGFCRTGFLDVPRPAAELVELTSWQLGLDKRYFSFCGDPHDMISKVGLCSGAGADYVEKAKEAGCDIFVTGDLKYHQALEAREMGMNVLDIGHYGSEHLFVENMAAYLRERTDAIVVQALTDTNPFVIL